MRLGIFFSVLDLNLNLRYTRTGTQERWCRTRGRRVEHGEAGVEHRNVDVEPMTPCGTREAGVEHRNVDVEHGEPR